MPYLSALAVWSRQGAIQIHIYLYLTFQPHSANVRDDDDDDPVLLSVSINSFKSWLDEHCLIRILFTIMTAT